MSNLSETSKLNLSLLKCLYFRYETTLGVKLETLDLIILEYF